MGRKKLKSGFYWRGAVIWVRTDPIDKLPRSTGCHTPEAAYLWHAGRELVAVNPRYAASLAATLGEWILKMLALKQKTRSAGTLHMYGVKLGHLGRVWGENSKAPFAVSLASIDAGRVDAYIDQRRDEGAGSNTIARELTCLRQLLRHAKRAGAWDGDLDEVMPIGFSSEYVPVTRTLAFEDFPKLWKALQDDTERAFVALAIGFAMDVGDIERAELGDYDRRRGVLRVRGTKNTSRAAEVPVLPHVRKLVEWAVKRLPVSWPRASKGVGEACVRAGIPHLSPKDLRRTAASWLVAAGADQRNVGRFLRHGSDAMVRKVYGQLTAEQVGKLLTESAETLQSEHGPLGGIGRRRGFKKLSDPRQRAARTDNSHSYENEQVPSGAVSRAQSLQLHALALAAERVLSRRVLIVRGAVRRRGRRAG
jgi:integrase/recombinase XerC